MKTELDTVNFFKQSLEKVEMKKQPGWCVSILTTAMLVAIFYWLTFHAFLPLATRIANNTMASIVATEPTSPPQNSEYEKINFYTMKEEMEQIEKLPLNQHNYARIQAKNALEKLNHLFASNQMSLASPVIYGVEIPPLRISSSDFRHGENEIYLIEWRGDSFLIPRKQ